MGVKKWDVIIVGGGFYGLRMAQFFREELKAAKVLVIEKEAEVMQHASYNNQARVHNGYHYPRSVLTALRSRVNLPVFCDEYGDAVDKSFDKYYGIATHLSKVSARQFERFFQRMGADIARAPEVRHLFDTKLVEDVFKVKEYGFDTTKLKKQLLDRVHQLSVTVSLKEKALHLTKKGERIILETDKDTYDTKYLINSTYSSINALNAASSLPIVPLKHELTEMCLVKLPTELEHKAFTMMCGPFFSLMPFPAKGKDMYTLSHVRYTPHTEWNDSAGDVRLRDGHAYMKEVPHPSNFQQMLADVKRYMPTAKKIEYSGESLWEVKTVLPQSEGDDSRPIMYLEHCGGIRNYICVMGGKIDNIYDVFRELKTTYGQQTG